EISRRIRGNDLERVCSYRQVQGDLEHAGRREGKRGRTGVRVLERFVELQDLESRPRIVRRVRGSNCDVVDSRDGRGVVEPASIVGRRWIQDDGWPGRAGVVD